jgi:hypothetical protein
LILNLSPLILIAVGVIFLPIPLVLTHFF